MWAKTSSIHSKILFSCYFLKLQNIKMKHTVEAIVNKEAPKKLEHSSYHLCKKMTTFEIATRKMS